MNMGYDRPMYISGKVLLQDGTPPPEPLVIELLCQGGSRPQGYTDSKGRFSFSLGQNQNMIADASSASGGPFGSSNMGGGAMNQTTSGSMNRGGIDERTLSGCELRAVLPGYRAEPVMLAGRRFMDNPDVGTIIMRRLGNVEGTTISMTSMMAPKDAKKSYEKGVLAARKKKWEEALPHLEKSVTLYPKYATAWYELGAVHEQSQRPAEARKAYEQSLAADAKYINPYLRLAAMAATERKWQEVADTTDRILKLNPVDFPSAFFYNAVANYNLQKVDAAEKSAREAVKLDTQHRNPRANHLLGVLLADKQDLAGAREQMSIYLKFAPTAPDADAVRQGLAKIDQALAAQNPAPASPRP
jgi:tetratricopeptide (TPR) repeat protein